MKKLFLLFPVILLLLLCSACSGYLNELPAITAEDLISAQTSFVYDENGEQIAELHGAENRISVPLSEMPQHLLDALVSTEDVRFYEHNGVDLRSIARAMKVNLEDTVANGELTFTQGASTITMQLVKNVVEEHEKTLTRKIKQAALAMEFEKSYSKEEILELYLNEIYLGPQIYGVQAASEYYFNKDVSDITIEEAAALVAILRAPGYYDPYRNPDAVITIRNIVLDNMAFYYPAEYGFTAVEAKALPLTVYRETDEVSAEYNYPWFVDTVIDEAELILAEQGKDTELIYTGGLRIYTTLDPNVQEALETVYADPANFPTSSTGDIVESAMAIVEPYSGKVKGLVGGREYTARRGFNRAADLARSPGSCIKPLVAYAPAVELGYGSGYVIDDSPVTYGDWSPKNDGGSYLGRITMRKAVSASRNICAVKMLNEIGVSTGWEYGNRLGLGLTDTDQNLSLTLGGLTYGVSPLQMAAAFSTFASEGIYTEPYTVLRIETAGGTVIYEADPRRDQVFDPETAYIMHDILRSAVTSGTGGNARISGWAVAGKTGTNGVPSSSDPDYAGISGNKDVWFSGYTSALAGSVWLGYDNKTDEAGNIQYLSSSVYGGNYAAGIFSKVMALALENYEETKISRPDGVISVKVDPITGLPSSKGTAELFREGFEFKTDGSNWETVNVCTESNCIATVHCPDYYELSIPLDENNKPMGEYPTERCPLHDVDRPASGNDWNNRNDWNDPKEQPDKGFGMEELKKLEEILKQQGYYPSDEELQDLPSIPWGELF